MTLSERLARIDSTVRPLLTSLPHSFVTKLYSHGRKTFLTRFSAENPTPRELPLYLQRHFWGIKFQSPISNAAGMFKNGEAYLTVAAQGAGAYLAGTTTALPRIGNTKLGITHPFAPYPHSRAASNWMGLPNRGHATVAHIISRITKQDGCPIGASVSSDPTQHGKEALAALIEGMEFYAKAGVDFIELNESCPNVVEGDHAPTKDELDAGLIERLETIATQFIRHDTYTRIPIIVKFSNDTAMELIPAIVELLSSLGFGGVNFGNTSTRYSDFNTKIHSRDARLYDYFTKTFGGGLSGAILKPDSYQRARLAVESIPKNITNTFGEFHVIRTGGIESSEDVVTSLNAGISLCQWYTGYFEMFAKVGHQVYHRLYDEIPIM